MCSQLEVETRIYWESAMRLRRFLRGELSARAAAPRACMDELCSMADHTTINTLWQRSSALTRRAEVVEAVQCASRA